MEINAEANLDEKAVEAEHKKQEEVLRRFRHLECNLLVSTQVLEEGMDIPLCNLVVRYDAASNFRSYVHSIGRARPSRSAYLFHLVSSQESEVLVKDLASYSAYTKVLMQNSTGKDGDSIILTAKNRQSGDSFFHLAMNLLT
mgnify:CR=1 FL=1